MKEDTNENDNLYIDNVDENAGIDKVLISTSSSLEDEEDLSGSPSVDTYSQNDDLMNILSKGKKEYKDTYEDPIRMYLKEIGDVKLLSRKDEEVLARTIDLKYKYKSMHDDLEESSTELINSIDVMKNVFESIVSLKPILESIGKFYGASKSNSLTLIYLTSKESEISNIHGVYSEDLVRYVADVNNISNDEVTQKIKELSDLLGLIPADLTELLADNFSKTNLKSVIKDQDFNDQLNMYKMIIDSHFNQILSRSDLAQNHLAEANLRLVVSIAKKYIGRG
ncbi:MAG: hypothetical protein Ct9H90mP2_14140 [Dehalococcoidia bacterium]|nr:MAG: hypothetical protein Ct9H90mP2_14140 [Dehalococcoidia bacterium]